MNQLQEFNIEWKKKAAKFIYDTIKFFNLKNRTIMYFMLWINIESKSMRTFLGIMQINLVTSGSWWNVKEWEALWGK